MTTKASQIDKKYNMTTNLKRREYIITSPLI